MSKDVEERHPFWMYNQFCLIRVPDSSDVSQQIVDWAFSTKIACSDMKKICVCLWFIFGHVSTMHVCCLPPSLACPLRHSVAQDSSIAERKETQSARTFRYLGVSFELITCYKLRYESYKRLCVNCCKSQKPCFFQFSNLFFDVNIVFVFFFFLPRGCIKWCCRQGNFDAFFEFLLVMYVFFLYQCRQR